MTTAYDADGQIRSTDLVPAAPILGVAQPPTPRPELALSWDQFSARVHAMVPEVVDLKKRLGENLTGIHPLKGADNLALALAVAAGVPLVPWVGSGVILVGLVARRCGEADRWVGQLGGNIPAVLWAYRAPEAPKELASEPWEGMGDPDRFPVNAPSLGDAWLIMPWHDDDAERSQP